jgi:predicted alpha/beta hydrolase family esterase/ribosomal protein S18 acetylase RimI-like enzyme
MPIGDAQNLDNWCRALREQAPFKFDENTILVGHSAGAAHILSILNQEREKPIKAAILVSGFYKKLGDSQFEPLLKTFVDLNFDWDLIKKNAGAIIQFHGDDDPYVPLTHAKELAKKLDSELIIIKNGGHLNIESNYAEFPELLNRIIAVKNGTNSEIVIEKVDPSDEKRIKKFTKGARLWPDYLAKLKKLAKDDQIVLFAAKIGDEYIGRATLVLSDWKSLEDKDGTSGSDFDVDKFYPNLPSVNAVQIDDRFRKRGAATKILEALHDEARARGYSAIGLGVETDNEPAKNLYEKMGYEIRPSGDRKTHRVWWSETDEKGKRRNFDIVCYLMIKNLTKEIGAAKNAIDGKLKIGLIREFIDDGVDADVKTRVHDFADKLRAAGHVVDDVSLPMAKYSLPIYYIVVPAELSSNLARFDGVRYGTRAPNATTLAEVYGRSRDEGFVDENKRRIMIGAYVLSSGYFDAYYLQAQKARTLLIREFDKLFASYDFLIGAVAPTPAFKIGERAADPIKMYLSDVMTVPASLAGLPAISLPWGTDRGGLPIGVQVIGAMKTDAELLKFAREVEE